MKSITINSNDAGQRLDKFLSKYMPRLPRSELYKGLRKSCVRINGSRVRDGAYKLRENDELKLFFRDEYYGGKREFIPSEVNFKIVYEDKNLLIINKPAGTVVHADEKHTSETLVEQVQSYLYGKGEYSPDEEHSFSPALCNRLDRNTAGLVIAAKNAPALREINEKIRAGEIRKFYRCRAEGKIDGSGSLSGYMTRNGRKSAVSSVYEKGALPVSLRYRALSYENGATELEIELLTGRTHQIRAQLAAAGHPLVNDRKYSSRGNGMYELTSSRLIFDFKDGGGILGYLKGRQFSL